MRVHHLANSRQLIFMCEMVVMSFITLQFQGIMEQDHMAHVVRKPVFGGLRTTKAQTDLHICAV